MPPVGPPLPREYNSVVTSYPVALDKDGQCTTVLPLLALLFLIAVIDLDCDEKTGEFVLHAHYRAGDQDFFVKITTGMWQGSCDVLAVTSHSYGQLILAVNPLSTTLFQMIVKDAYGQPLKDAFNVGVAVKNANAVEVGPGVRSVFLSDQVYGFPSQLTAARTAEGERVRLEHTRESTCAGYAGGTATCTATYVADARSHLTVFASAEVTTISLAIGVLLPGVPLCSESVAGYDSSVELYFESPLGCEMFDNVSFFTKKLVDTTNATATALEVANTSCTSATEPDVHRRLAPAAASVAFLFHTHGLEEAEKIAALLPADESALKATLNVPVIPGSVKISVTQDESALASTLNVPVTQGIRAPSESSDLHRKPVELLAGVGVPVLIACCLAVLVLISCGIFARRRRRLALVNPAPPAGVEGEPWRQVKGAASSKNKGASSKKRKAKSKVRISSGIFARRLRHRALVGPAPRVPAKAAVLAGGKGQPNPPGVRFNGFFAARARIAKQTPQQVQRDWLYWKAMTINDENDDARPGVTRMTPGMTRI